MSTTSVDGMLVAWGDRLFYGSNRIVRSNTPRLSLQAQAGVVRQRIKTIVVRNAPQVMVKVTGGGRGMGAIAAHLRYIGKSGRLPFEDDRGEVRQGREALRDLADQWRCGGARIPERSERREAFNIMLAMPAGTKREIVHNAAREFAQAELANHRYVMVLHTHQANPRKQDLRRWREGLCREAARQGHRSGGVVEGRARQLAPQRTALGAQGLRRRPDCEACRDHRREAHAGAATGGAGLVRDCQGARVVGRRGRPRVGPVGRQLRALAARGALQATGKSAAAGAAGAGADFEPAYEGRARVGTVSREGRDRSQPPVLTPA
jgi:hypothetical protein